MGTLYPKIQWAMVISNTLVNMPNPWTSRNPSRPVGNPSIGKGGSKELLIRVMIRIRRAKRQVLKKVCPRMPGQVYPEVEVSKKGLEKSPRRKPHVMRPYQLPCQRPRQKFRQSNCH